MKLKFIFLFFLFYITSASASISGKGNAAKITATERVLAFDQKKPIAVKVDSAGYRNAARAIEKFYREYVRAFSLPGQYSTDLLERKYLTEGLREKVHRVGASTDMNTIIRAQDVNEQMLKTIKARHLSGNWYMVDYNWSPDGNKGHQEIPIRVTKINGHYMIDYITPYWNGSSYGDSLLLNKLSTQKINTASPLSLIKTFYTAYVSEYCSMPKGLESRLEALRKTYLTPNALAQFKKAEAKQKLDGFSNWDLLIADFDFDCLWIPSITYRQLQENVLEMHYVKGPDFKRAIRLEVARSGNGYKINKIHIEKAP